MSVAAVARTFAPAPPPVAVDAAPARSLLRFITCGSVDDGKSTLIGRLLCEAGAIPDDALATLQADSARVGSAEGALDYALLVDGLAAEREQGITIDVAYRYFATRRRAFIVADTPGHEQYTRNMATGASSADLAIILVDARKGVLPQTRRHSLIAALVGVRHVVVAINKIDLIGYDALRVQAIEASYRAAVAGLGFATITVIPVSARGGDNIAAASPRTPWFDGPTLLERLETIDVEPARAAQGFVMPVQWINRPDADFRGLAGTIAAGVARVGALVVAAPSGAPARIARIVTFDGDLEQAGAGVAVNIVLDRDVDVARGDVLLAADDASADAPRAREEAVARLLVTGDGRIAPGASFVVRIGSATANARVIDILHRTDIDDFRAVEATTLGANELGLVRLRFDRPLVVAPYAASRDLGALILVDRFSNATAAVGTIVAAADAQAGATPLRDSAARLLERMLGPHWRAELAPAASWRLASAGALGLVVALLAGSATAGLAAAALDAMVRPLLRAAHGAVWRRARARAALAAPGQNGDGI